MSKVTSKLQVTIPKTIAEAYGIRPGSEVSWLPAGDAIRVESASTLRRPKVDLQKRLALFDQMTERIERLPPVKAAAPDSGRGWRREELYAERLDRYGRPRRH